MLRRSLYFFALASLLICIATVVVWIRSGPFPTRSIDRMWSSAERLRTDHLSGRVERGLLRVFWIRVFWPDRAGYDQKVQSDSYVAGWSSGGWGFTFSGEVGKQFGLYDETLPFISQRARGFDVPLWCVALLTAMPPLLAGRVFIRHRRRTRIGACPTCGYDLRATPDRCPECGAKPR